jgi:hypothetical protein
MLYPTDMRSILAGEALARQQGTPSTDQFRTSLTRHLDALIEEEEGLSEAVMALSDAVIPRYNAHAYAASLLREIKAWVEVES